MLGILGSGARPCSPFPSVVGGGGGGPTFPLGEAGLPGTAADAISGEEEEEAPGETDFEDKSESEREAAVSWGRRFNAASVLLDLRIALTSGVKSDGRTIRSSGDEVPWLPLLPRNEDASELRKIALDAIASGDAKLASEEGRDQGASERGSTPRSFSCDFSADTG